MKIKHAVDAVRHAAQAAPGAPDRATTPGVPTVTRVVGAGVAAGATVVALAAASAVTSRVRHRMDGS